MHESIDHATLWQCKKPNFETFKISSNISFFNLKEIEKIINLDCSWSLGVVFYCWFLTSTLHRCLRNEFLFFLQPIYSFQFLFGLFFPFLYGLFFQLFFSILFQFFYSIVVTFWINYIFFSKTYFDIGCRYLFGQIEMINQLKP